MHVTYGIHDNESPPPINDKNIIIFILSYSAYCGELWISLIPIKST